MSQSVLDCFIEVIVVVVRSDGGALGTDEL